MALHFTGDWEQMPLVGKYGPHYWRRYAGSTVGLCHFVVAYNPDFGRWAVYYVSVYQAGISGINHPQAWAKSAGDGMAQAEELATVMDRNEALATQLVASLLG